MPDTTTTNAPTSSPAQAPAGSSFEGKRMLVMGLGRFGGGLGVTRYLASQGAEVLVTDLTPEAELRESAQALADLAKRGRVRFRLGEHNVSDFTANVDAVVANPAVPKPWENRFLRAAAAAGVPITSEIGLTVERLPNRERVIGVTGSVGKSTTTAMIHHALAEVLGERSVREGEAHKVVMGGNIGGSLLSDIASGRIDESTFVALELSSAQLWWLADPQGPMRRALDKAVGQPAWSPRVAVITNISANHLDWHGEFEHYARSKQSLLRAQQPGDAAIFVHDGVADWCNCTKAVCIRPSKFDLPMLLPGGHNRVNAGAALEACVAVLGAEGEARRNELARAIASFGGLAHRLQLVCEKGKAGGVRFYNDSKSTTPESCLKAVEAIAATLDRGTRAIHLIAGGYDKKTPLDAVAALAPKLAGLYTIGATGPAIAAAARAAGDGADAHIDECATLSVALAAAIAHARPGDAVLLSPACASWDQYPNFEARGDEFIRLVTAS